MSNGGQIRVVPGDIDDVVSRLRELASDASTISETSYSLGYTTGDGGDALLEVGEETNECAKALAGAINSFADKLENAKSEFENTDFMVAQRVSLLGSITSAVDGAVAAIGGVDSGEASAEGTSDSAAHSSGGEGDGS